jgi:hypothetical protein
VRVVWVLDVLVIRTVNWHEGLVPVLCPDDIHEGVLDFLGEFIYEECGVLIVIEHVLLMLRGPLVLLEGVVILALLPAHLAVEFMLP